MTSLRDIVFRELDAAVDERGYRWLCASTPEYVAFHLIRYSGLDDRYPEELVPAVQEWLQQRREGA
jgi:hypothetical protein